VFRNNDAYSGFSVDDIAKAKEFYGETLGLEVSEGTMGELTIKLGSGGKLFVYSKPNHVPATYTMLNFVVPDIHRAVDDLVAAGVQMEHYDMPQIKTDAKGITRAPEGFDVAWFKDPAGNIIAVLDENPDR
jgi:predicted enzyme related to lactoylglutathione lyase